MEELIASRLLAVGTEDTILLSFAAAALLYFFMQSRIGVSKHEKARIREFFSIPQEGLYPSSTVSCFKSKNICDAIKSPTGAQAVVFWASQSGTAEALASRYASELSTSLSLRVLTANLSDYDHKYLPDVPPEVSLVFFLPTFGNGDPPDNGVVFLESLRQLRDKGRQLSNVRYAMFGLGNSIYAHFNKFALDVDSILIEMNATRLGALGLGDDRTGATEEDFVTWKNEATQQMARALHIELAKRRYSPRLQIRPSKGMMRGVSTTVYYGEPPNLPPSPDISNNLILPITRAQQLITLEATPSRQCVHLEFNLEDHPSITYETGDYLCIWPINPDHEVSALLKVLGVWDKRKEIVDILPVDDASYSSIRIPTPATIESLFRHCLDICGPVSREVLVDISEFFTDHDFQRRLQALASNRDVFHEKVTSERLTLAKVLQTMRAQCENETTMNIPVSYILENLKKLQPRTYSISSSAAVEPRVLSIIAISESPTETALGSTILNGFRGLASSYLLQLQQEFCQGEPWSQQPTSYYSTAGPRDLLRGGKIFARVRRSTFKLPSNPSTPIIMVGAGTGVAPFRGFVRERMKHKTQGSEVGKTILLVGHRAPDQDYYYQDLWREAEKTLGEAFELYTAFSRVDNQPPRYVQDVLTTKQDLVLDILTDDKPEGGALYVCGSSLMAKGVRECLVDMRSRSSQESLTNLASESAEEWLERLARLRRLQEDSWS